MKRYQALLQERADLVAEGRAVFAAAEAEDRALTAEEIAADDAREQKLTALSAEIAAIERQRERERNVATVTPLAVPGGVSVGSIARPAALEKPWGYEYGVRAIEQADGTIKLGGVQNAPRLALGAFLQATHRARVGGERDPRLVFEAAAQGAGEAVGADGGFLVGKEMADEITLAVYTGDILAKVRRRTLAGNANSIELNVINETSRATGSRFGGVQSYWVDEGTAPTASRPAFAKVAIKPRKIAALGYATDELLADASLLGDLMFDAFVEDIRWQVENAIVRGTGAGQPQGILNANCLVTVSAETGQAATTVVAENIVKMHARLHARSRRNAIWLINQDTEPELHLMQVGLGMSNALVYMPPGGLSGSPFATLYGAPVVPVEYCSTLGTVGDIIYADFSQYFLADKGDAQQASSMHVAFTTDEQAFRVTYRVDGQATWRSALTPANGTNTLSPFVALATRS